MELETEICRLATDINAATCRWMRLLADFDRLGGHARAGFHSCTAWLAWHCALTARAAREHVRVARALRGLPAIEAAFASGELSYSKVRALTRVANPALEGELLELARHATAAQLEAVVRSLRRSLADDPDQLALERRHLALRWEPDGMLRVSGLLPAEEGELLIKAVESAREQLRREGGSTARPDRADGLGAIAEATLAHGHPALSGGERNQVVLHVDAEHLAGRSGGSGSAAGTLGRGGIVGADAVRRIACDAAIVTLVERAGEPVSVGRRTRSVPPAIQRALRSRDRCCAFPGCEHERYVDAHHIHHWADGGETSLENLVLLCRRHHRLLHEEGFTVERSARGRFRFLRPDGTEVGRRERHAPRPLRPAAARLRRGSGDALDLDHAVMLLARSSRREAWGDRVSTGLAPVPTG